VSRPKQEKVKTNAERSRDKRLRKKSAVVGKPWLTLGRAGTIKPVKLIWRGTHKEYCKRCREKGYPLPLKLQRRSGFGLTHMCGMPHVKDFTSNWYSNWLVKWSENPWRRSWYWKRRNAPTAEQPDNWIGFVFKWRPPHSEPPLSIGRTATRVETCSRWKRLHWNGEWRPRRELSEACHREILRMFRRDEEIDDQVRSAEIALSDESRGVVIPDNVIDVDRLEEAEGEENFGYFSDIGMGTVASFGLVHYQRKGEAMPTKRELAEFEREERRMRKKLRHTAPPLFRTAKRWTDGGCQETMPMPREMKLAA
jgi:hypothetical protein